MKQKLSSLPWRALITVLLFAVFALTGCAQKSSRNAGAMDIPVLSEVGTEPYRIGVGDVIAVNVWRNPELSPTAVVRPDGYISIPLMGDLLAAGKRPEDLAELIDAAISTVVRNPEVTVIVANPVSSEYRLRVRITGQVGNPTSLPFRPGMTVLDLVLLAGGVTDFGAGNRALLHRTVADETSGYAIDLRAILDDGDLRTNYPLQPGDVISVPRKKVLRGEF